MDVSISSIISFYLQLTQDIQSFIFLAGRLMLSDSPPLC
jgi:hypothetical protein